MLRKFLSSSLLIALAGVGALAQSTGNPKELRELQKEAARLDKEASRGQEQAAIYESMSRQLNIPVATLQAQQKSTEFGFGQLFVANSLAASSGKSFEELSRQFKSGKGWGDIAGENNVRLGTVVSDLKRTNNQVERTRIQRTEASRGFGTAADKDRQANPRSVRGASASPKSKPRH